jgi:hypothetical protein
LAEINYYDQEISKKALGDAGESKMLWKELPSVVVRNAYTSYH